MLGPFVHRIDPVLAKVGPFYLWWYGLGYALGFLEIHLWLRRARRRLGLTIEDVYTLSILLIAGVLIGGRLVEVVFYEWPFYRRHLWLIPAYWLGGMATHGLLAGAATGTWLFCRKSGKPFLQIADELVIPGAFLLGMGRIGNFIDGQIVGRVTDVPWAVQFPDAEGFRHPVVLYDGVKNLLLIPLLLWIRRSRPSPGVVMAHFLFWYGFLRIFVDLLREYPTRLLGLATGQGLNIFLAILGAALLIVFTRRERRERVILVVSPASPPRGPTRPILSGMKRVTLVSLLLLSLTMPSDWTQDIPARYGKRHPGLRYSTLYPHIDATSTRIRERPQIAAQSE